MRRFGKAQKARAKRWDELNRRCFNADCPDCMKSKPMCRFSRLKMLEMNCQERENDAYPSLGYPGSVSRDAYEEFRLAREFERKERGIERDKKELREYRKLKKEGKI